MTDLTALIERVESGADAEPWPLGWDGKPVPFVDLPHAKRRRLLKAKRVSIPSDAIQESRRDDR